MADLVLGAGTSHSPLVTMGVDSWIARAKEDLQAQSLNLSDGRTLSYQALLRESGPRYAEEARRENFVRQHDAVQRALDRQAAEIAAAGLDLAIIVGDDQGELFDSSQMPAIAIYCGEEVVMHPWDEAEYSRFPWRREAAPGYSMDVAHRHAGAPEAAVHLIEALIRQGVDVAVASKVTDPEAAGFGHAYGFIIERLLGRGKVPVVPVLLNTYFPPNVPTPARCHDIGRMIAEAVRTMPGKARVGIVASGGLSHFVTDVELDRKVLGAMAEGDADVLRSLPRQALRSGSSEILNWVMTAGAIEGMHTRWIEYLPVRRTPAGTGCGLAFGIWAP